MRWQREISSDSQVTKARIAAREGLSVNDIYFSSSRGLKSNCYQDFGLGKHDFLRLGRCRSTLVSTYGEAARSRSAEPQFAAPVVRLGSIWG